MNGESNTGDDRFSMRSDPTGHRCPHGRSRRRVALTDAYRCPIVRQHSARSNPEHSVISHAQSVLRIRVVFPRDMELGLTTILLPENTWRQR